MKSPDSIPLINVIIADDHLMFRKGLRGMLGTLSFIKNISEASDGNEVLHLLKTKSFDLVFLDISMEGMDGKTAAHYIHEHYPCVSIIVISMSEDSYTIRQMYLAGCHGYLTKHSDEHEILKAIRTVMSGKKYFSANSIEKLALETDNETLKRAQRSYDFTIAEQRIVSLIIQEKTNKEIADQLYLSVRTVENHRYNIFKKSGVRNTREFLHFVIDHHLVVNEYVAR